MRDGRKYRVATPAASAQRDVGGTAGLYPSARRQAGRSRGITPPQRGWSDAAGFVPPVHAGGRARAPEHHSPLDGSPGARPSTRAQPTVVVREYRSCRSPSARSCPP